MPSTDLPCVMCKRLKRGQHTCRKCGKKLLLCDVCYRAIETVFDGLCGPCDRRRQRAEAGQTQ